MILYLSDNRFHYELENITRLFFWKVEVHEENPQTLPLSRIASECGFSDYNYFITVHEQAINNVIMKKYNG